MTNLGALLPRKFRADAKKVITLLCSVLLLVGTGKAVFARGESSGVIHVDIPVKLDKAYNAFRKVSTGNPYKPLVAGLL